MCYIILYIGTYLHSTNNENNKTKYGHKKSPVPALQQTVFASYYTNTRAGAQTHTHIFRYMYSVPVYRKYYIRTGWATSFSHWRPTRKSGKTP